MSERNKNRIAPFEKGQRVWLEAKNLKLPYSKKISSKREGPFIIEEVMGPVTYKLKLPARWRIHNVFHATLLTPFIETEAHGPNFLNPELELVDGEEEYEVEAILGHRRSGRGYRYLIRWKDMSSEEDSWEPVIHLKNAQELLNEYKLRHKL